LCPYKMCVSEVVQRSRVSVTELLSSYYAKNIVKFLILT